MDDRALSVTSGGAVRQLQALVPCERAGGRVGSQESQPACLRLRGAAGSAQQIPQVCIRLGRLAVLGMLGVRMLLRGSSAPHRKAFQLSQQIPCGLPCERLIRDESRT